MPPVTADRSPPDSRMTGADSPVTAASLTEAMPSITSPSEGIRSPASTSTIWPGPSLPAGSGHDEPGLLIDDELGLGLLAGLTQARGLRLAAAFGDGFGEIGEQHGQPKPEDDLEGEAEMLASVHPVANEDDGGEGGDDLDHEHHRILDLHARIELAESRADRRPKDLRIGQEKRPASVCV